VDFKELLGSAHQPPHHAASDEQAEDAVGNQHSVDTELMASGWPYSTDDPDQ
jgi:hypothetical protein